MRTVYFGTSDFAAAVLGRLAAGEHRPQLVVTRPDRPRGRGRKLQSPPVADAARALGIELTAPEDPHAPEILARVRACEPDRLVVCAYGVIVRPALLDTYEIFNLHPSLLPRWRGAAPIERAIMAGDSRTGISIMRLTAGLDSGPVCMAESVAIEPGDDYGSLSARLQTLGGDLLVRALDELPPFREQSEDGLIYAEKIEANDRDLDPRMTALELDRVVRGLRPHIGARLGLAEGEFLGVIEARPAADLRVAPGELESRGDRLGLGCRDGVLELLAVKPAGGRVVSAADWLRGRR